MMKKILSIPILFLACFVFFVYFLLPVYFEFKQVKEYTVQKQLELEKQKGEVLELEQISRGLQEHKEALGKIHSGLPEELSVASLLNFFQEKASETGVILKAFSPQDLSSRGTGNQSERKEESAPVSKPKETYFTLNIAGSFPSLENFLRTIEKSSRLIEVESLSLSQKQKEGDLLDLSLFIKVYSY